MTEQKAMTTPAVSAFSSITAFVDACRMAKALCSSPLVPKEYQGEQNLGSALIALELAQRMDASPLMVMQNIDVIHGRPSWRAQMAIAAINASGRFSPIRYEMSEEGPEETINGTRIRNRSCRAYAFDMANGERLEGPLVDMKIAIMEGWYSKQGSKWRTIPELMLRYRAAAWWQRQYAPELLMGLPLADEVRDTIDVTPTSVVVGNHKTVDALVAEARDDAPPVPSEEPTAPEPIPEWPKLTVDESTGYEVETWTDSRGIVFSPDHHAMSADGHPSVTQAGVFRRRRGAHPAEVQQYEQGQQQDPLQATPQAEAPAPQQQTAQTYPVIMHAIQRAKDRDALVAANELILAYQGPEDHKAELFDSVKAMAEMLKIDNLPPF